MKYTKHLAFALLFCFFVNGYAQKLNRWSISAATNGGLFNYMGINSWITNYNKVLYPNLEKNFNKLLMTGGFGFGTSFVVKDYFHLGFEFERMYQRTSSRSKDPLFPTRYLGINANIYSVEIGASLEVGDGWRLKIIFPTIGILRTNLDSYMKYKNGDITFDNENVMNGKFDNSNAFNFWFDLSVEAMYDINKYLSVFGGLKAGFGGSFRTGVSDMGKQFTNSSLAWRSILTAGMKFNIINKDY